MCEYKTVPQMTVLHNPGYFYFPWAASKQSRGMRVFWLIAHRLRMNLQKIAVCKSVNLAFWSTSG